MSVIRGSRRFHPHPRRGRRVRAVSLTLATALWASAACSFGAPPPDQAGQPPRLPTPSASADAGGAGQEVVATVLARNLAAPWGVAFLPDGSALVTERETARILQVGPDIEDDGLKVVEVQRLTEAQPSSGGGLLGIAVSPQYETDKSVFVYYSTATDNRVAQLTLKGVPRPILTGIPRSPEHNGGQLAFGPDGYLYVGTGDASARGAAPAKGLGGKVLRVTTAGKPAPGNPGKDSPVFSSGHRNVQGLAWDAAKRLYASDAGQATDELNLIDKGRNYGWPGVEGSGTDPKLTNPLASWPTAEGACAGTAVIERLIVTACLRGERLWLIESTEAGTVFGRPQPALVGEYGRLRAAVAAPDGSLWLTTSNRDGQGQPKPDDDQIIRIVFSGGGAGRT